MVRLMTRRKSQDKPPALPLPILAIIGVVAGGGIGWVATMPAPERASFVAQPAEMAAQGLALLKPEPRPYRNFSGCNDARAAGYENITRDEPSYRADMDGDNDGIACEPYR